MTDRRIVAKFGGTSMARPDTVLSLLGHERNRANIVVVSAPGVDDKHPEKTTDMLLGYEKASEEEKRELASRIRDRFADIVRRIDPDNKQPDLLTIVEAIPDDILAWPAGSQVAALGEYWSAKLFAEYGGFEFVDAKDLIAFDDQARLKLDVSMAHINALLTDPHKVYVVPGFYGSSSTGIRTFDRGGSDISGAVLAWAVHADEYHNWSDVPGYMSSDPRIVNGRQDDEVKPLTHLTYREARELGNGGSGLLHRDVIGILGNTDITTLVRHTMGDAENIGTVISKERDWSESPVIGVSGRRDVLTVSFGKYGLNEETGSTRPIYELLAMLDIPYEHIATGTDNVTLYIPDSKDGGYGKRLLAALEDGRLRTKVEEALGPIELGETGMVHIVGEGLAESGPQRLATLGKAALALGEKNTGGNGATDTGRSASITIFVDQPSVDDAIRIVHKALSLGSR